MIPFLRLLVILEVLGGFCPSTLGHMIRVSSNIGFSGITQEIRLGNACFNLAHPINDDISSVDPNGKCIRLYTNERCRGSYVETHEIISDLTSRNINDAVSSIKLCHTVSLSSRSKWGDSEKTDSSENSIPKSDDAEDLKYNTVRMKHYIKK